MRLTWFAPVLLLAWVGCAPYTIRHDFDSAAPLAAYRTYDWYQPKAEKGGAGAPRMSAFNDARVRAAVERELGAKQLRRETGADPDVLLDYFPVYQKRHATTHTRVGVGTGGWGWGMRTSIGTSRRHTWKEGTIVLQMVDFKSNKLVWEGVAEGALTDVGTPQEAEEAIGRAVRDLLEGFPPKK